MFDLEKKHLRDMPYELFEELIARLCMAEIQAGGGSRRKVWYGGEVSTPDGGVDVEVRAEDSNHVGDFIPRRWTRIQAKTGKIGHADIKREMVKSGCLRPAIADVVSNGGCYMIVSLGADPGALAIGELQETMFQAVSGKTQDREAVRFLGISQILQWAQPHHLVSLWLREKLNIETHGWRSHGSWSLDEIDHEDTLITDPGVRIFVDTPVGPGLEIGEGIIKLRALAQNPRKPVRILGHAGVGKTRIAQALFEDRPDENVLDHTKVLYADCAVPLQPSPNALLGHLIAEAKQWFLVFDNCSTDLHNTLARIVRTSDSRVHLITVDVNARHDRPGQTHVVQIRAKGTQAATKLLIRRFLDIRRENAERIAKAAGGNARMATALAGNIDRGENITTLSDDDLYRRLVWMEDGLSESAEVLSLVYSFSTDTSEQPSELTVLGDLADQSVKQLHSHANLLVNRQLAERRGNWLAIFPMAVANRYARDALQRIPRETIISAFQPATAPRLFQSHVHRFSYLHDSDEAVSIAKSWFSNGGPLSNLARIDEKNAVIICYAAAILPRDVLRKIEEWIERGQHMLPDTSPGFLDRLIDALTLIACDEDVFGRCIDALMTLVRQKMDSPGHWLAHERAFMLFSFRFRWIGVGIKERFDVILRYLLSDDAPDQIDGLFMLYSALDLIVSPFQHLPEYGARTYGQSGLPEDNMDESEWCVKHLGLLSQSVADLPESALHGIRVALSSAFRNLWSLPEIREELIATSGILGARGPWNLGWTAVLRVRSLLLAGEKTESREDECRLLTQLAKALQPRDPVNRVRACILSFPPSTSLGDDVWVAFPPVMPREKFDVCARTALRLGKCAARMEPADLLRILSGMIGDENEHTYLFARGVARESNDLVSLWNKLVVRLDKMSEKSHKSLNVFLGIIDEAREHSSSLAQKILDTAVEHLWFRERFATLQQRVSLDHHAVTRLEACLKGHTIDTGCFADIAWKEPFIQLPARTVERLLLYVASKPGGALAVMKGLSSRFKIPSKIPVEPRLSRLGTQIAAQALREARAGSGRYLSARTLREVLEVCLRQEVPQSVLRELIEGLVLRLGLIIDRDSGIPGIIHQVTERLPYVTLDILFVESDDTDVVNRFLTIFHERESSALGRVRTEELLSWAGNGDRETRLCQVARVLWPIETAGDNGEVRLTTAARKLIGAAENPVQIALVFAQSLSVMPRQKDDDATIATRRTVFREFASDSDSTVRKWAKAATLHLESLTEEYLQKRQRMQPQPFE